VFRACGYRIGLADLAFAKARLPVALNSSARTQRGQPLAIVDDTRSAAVEQLPARAIRAYLVRLARIECLEGELWVTGPGIGDEVLLRGESIAISRPGKVVVQALVAARVRMRAAD
jgi:hypothetical protein